VNLRRAGSLGGEDESGVDGNGGGEGYEATKHSRGVEERESAEQEEGR
jgi:hypothetical protein